MCDRRACSLLEYSKWLRCCEGGYYEQKEDKVLEKARSCHSRVTLAITVSCDEHERQAAMSRGSRRVVIVIVAVIVMEDGQTTKANGRTGEMHPRLFREDERISSEVHE
jgi:hypothetical protein